MPARPVPVRPNPGSGLRRNRRYGPARRLAAYQRVAGQARVIHQPVQELPRENGYDLIISGLPLNNFPAALLDEVLESLSGLLKPNGTLSFFQYVAVRPARAIVSGRVERLRLREVGAALGKVLDRHEFRRDLIWPNLPPAWVHHIRF